MINLSKKKFKFWFNTLRVIKAVTGALGMSAVITDYKFLGVFLLCVGAASNELISILSEEDNFLDGNL